MNKDIVLIARKILETNRVSRGDVEKLKEAMPIQHDVHAYTELSSDHNVDNVIDSIIDHFDLSISKEKLTEYIEAIEEQKDVIKNISFANVKDFKYMVKKEDVEIEQKINGLTLSVTGYAEKILDEKPSAEVLKNRIISYIENTYTMFYPNERIGRFKAFASTVNIDDLISTLEGTKKIMVDSAISTISLDTKILLNSLSLEIWEPLAELIEDSE